eukprot:2512111-Amphidinium_carterae.2
MASGQLWSRWCLQHMCTLSPRLLVARDCAIAHVLLVLWSREPYPPEVRCIVLIGHCRDEGVPLYQCITPEFAIIVKVDKAFTIASSCPVKCTQLLVEVVEPLDCIVETAVSSKSTVQRPAQSPVRLSNCPMMIRMVADTGCASIVTSSATVSARGAGCGGSVDALSASIGTGCGIGIVVEEDCPAVSPFSAAIGAVDGAAAIVPKMSNCLTVAKGLIVEPMKL